MKQIFTFLFHRVFLIAFSILIQTVVLVTVIWRFNSYFVYFYAMNIILSILAVFWVINKNSNPSYKMAWIIPILLFPIFGGVFYLLLGNHDALNRSRKNFLQLEENTKECMQDQTAVKEAIKSQSLNAYRQSVYIEKFALSGPYDNTETAFYGTGESFFDSLIEALKTAEHYIFMEYFIIAEGVMWDTILDILSEKAAQGVDVRLIYDDIGCILTLPANYVQKIRKLGIQCYVFNPFKPIVSISYNNRDHRKITVVDGHTGFTGGINLADEYINIFEKHGHWNDSAIRIKGEAVWSLTTMFLTLWENLSGDVQDYEQFHLPIPEGMGKNSKGFVQPFTDNPFDDEAAGETIYLNLIYKAKKSVYITSPYLVIDNEMIMALTSAAKSGVDVRIITPGVPDKSYVHAVTQSNYQLLIESGVKIYEYKPGFMHSKTFLVDDKYGVVGTVNLDYRSFYLHLECGVWMYQTESIEEMKTCYFEILKECENISLEQCKNIPFIKRIWRGFLKIFAPLM